MKLNQLILPTLAIGVGAAFFLSAAQEAQGWNLLGSVLGQNQRDFRIYNNFSDSSDNNNTTPHPNFPGALGAPMAIWKGVIEWGSLPHGDGTGDSTQTVLGSGEANFDSSYQGAATEVGLGNQNIHSQISGSSGGTLAFAEGNGGAGWRIRYYEGIPWADGPGTIQNGQYDLQGVACHEYGHALGMGHSASFGSTMFASVGPGVESKRSISNDDRGGIAAAYGLASATKPIISGVGIAGNQITITGSGFDLSGNEIWFTKAGNTSNGVPIKVSNLSSSAGGTMILATIPVTAAEGDVLVRRNSTSHSGLSNAWPTDLVSTGTGGCAISTYCLPSPNSIGPGATIGSTGTGSLGANSLTLNVLGLPPTVPMILFYADNQIANLFGEGLLCAQGNLKRLNVQFADALGSAVTPLDLSSSPFDSGNGEAIAGETKNFQYWYRDVSGGPNGFNTSDGLSVTFCD
ncbi:MAG: hypothetical protein ACI8X5_001801 [Planctomycetota bacterium]|jgi:hypothetical protein